MHIHSCTHIYICACENSHGNLSGSGQIDVLFDISTNITTCSLKIRSQSTSTVFSEGKPEDASPSRASWATLCSYQGLVEAMVRADATVYSKDSGTDSKGQEFAM